MRILLVDSDLDLVELLVFVLQRAGFGAMTAHDPAGALKRLDGERPDLAVIDLNLGEWDGFALLEELRRRSSIPVIVLTARLAEADKVRALESGADDYVTKPFSHRELIARIRAQLRRHGHPALPPGLDGALLRVGPLTLNAAEHSVAIAGKALKPTVTEFRLLRYLMLNAGTVVPARAILKQVWGYEDANGTAVVRVTMHRLRRKLEAVYGGPTALHIVPGVGVILKREWPDGHLQRMA